MNPRSNVCEIKANKGDPFDGLFNFENKSKSNSSKSLAEQAAESSIKKNSLNVATLKEKQSVNAINISGLDLLIEPSKILQPSELSVAINDNVPSEKFGNELALLNNINNTCSKVENQIEEEEDVFGLGIIASKNSSSKSESPCRTSVEHKSVDVTQEKIMDDHLALLVSMGYDSEEAKRALFCSNNDVQRAVEILLDQEKSSFKTAANHKDSSVNKFDIKSKTRSMFNSAKEKVFSFFDFEEPLSSSSSNLPKDNKVIVNRGHLTPSAVHESKQTVKNHSPPKIFLDIDFSQLENASALKGNGDSLLKSGQYESAEKEYSCAIEIVLEQIDKSYNKCTLDRTILSPNLAQLLSSLYINRAICRLKNGNTAGCISDCGVVTNGNDKIEAISPNNVTALLKTAEALEELEKIPQALIVLRKVSQIEPTNQFCKNSIQRLEGPPINKPKEVITPAIRESPPVHSKALLHLQKIETQSKMDESIRFELKDSVDGKINTWKNGKEKNIRALLASLHLLLWPELEWKQVSLSDLITPAKVKMAYFKVISKVHPDKLQNLMNSSDTQDIKERSKQIERILIANGIFGIINEAWDDFRANNSM